VESWRLQAQWLLRMSPGQTFRNSTTCSQGEFLCFLCVSLFQNTHWLFPYTALMDWVYTGDEMCLLCGTK